MNTTTGTATRLILGLTIASLLYVGPLGSRQAMAQEQSDPIEDAIIEDLQQDDGDPEVVYELQPTGTVEGTIIQEPEPEVPEPGPAIGMTILGATSTAFGIVFLVKGGQSSDDADVAWSEGDTLWAEYLDDQAHGQKVTGGVLVGIGAALLGVATYFWIDYAKDRRAARDQAADDDVSFNLLPSVDPEGGGGLFLTGTF